MSSITVYTFEYENGTEDTYQTQDPIEAEERGRAYEMRVISNEYTWNDSDTAWDFRPVLYRVEVYTTNHELAILSRYYDNSDAARDDAEEAANWTDTTVGALNTSWFKGKLISREDAPVVSAKVVRHLLNGNRLGD